MAAETQWATRDELQALTEAVDRSQDRERIAKLEGKVGESDKLFATFATKADVADIRTELAGIKSDVRVLRIWLFVIGFLVIVLDEVEWLQWLLRLAGGGL